MNIIKGNISVDDRGALAFINDFNPTSLGVKRFYQVSNHKQGFIRAWHGHKNETKYAYVPSGAARIVIFPIAAYEEFLTSMDLNKLLDSLESRVLSSYSPTVMEIPAGYYNGAQTLTPDTIITYFSTSSLEESKEDDLRLDGAFLSQIWKDSYR